MKQSSVFHFGVDDHLQTLVSGETFPYPLQQRKKTITTIASHCKVLTISHYSIISDQMLRALPHLELIVTRTAGTDHIDIAACKKHGIAVYNIPNYGAYNIAEHTLALLLSASRNICAANKQTHSGRFDYTSLLAFSLKSKTIGVIGTGKIGISLIQRLQGFGMRIHAYDVVKNQSLAKKYNFSYQSLPKLLKMSDIVSIHVPLLDQTRHMIGDKELRGMKKGAILINTARGAIIDEKALQKHIKKFHAVCLDVIDDERGFSKNHPLLVFPNVIITPHSAFFSDASVKIIAQETRANIDRFKTGDRTNRVV